MVLYPVEPQDEALWLDKPWTLVTYWYNLLPSRAFYPHQNTNALARLIIGITIALVVATGDVISRVAQCGVALMLSILIKFPWPTTTEHSQVTSNITPYFDLNRSDKPDDRDHEEEDVPLDTDARKRMAVGVRGAPGRTTVRSADKTRIYATRSVFDIESDDLVITDNTVVSLRGHGVHHQPDPHSPLLL